MIAFLGSIRFAGDWPIWLVVLLVIAAVVGVLALYLHESKSLALPYRYLLPGLRATAVAMVLLILSGPIWHRRQVVGTLGRVVFAVDTSQSMSLSDSTDGQPDSTLNHRLARATRILLGDQTQPGWLEQITNTHSVDVIAFNGTAPARIWSSDDGSELPNAFDWSAEGDATDLASPVALALSSLNLRSNVDDSKDDSDSLRRSAMVLMTDGQDTVASDAVGRSATGIAKRLHKAGTNVNALGIGSMEEPPDVGMVDVSHPETVAAEGKLAGQLVLKQFGDAKEPVAVRIEADGNVVWEQEVRIGDSGRRTVPFEIDVEPLVGAVQGQAPRGIKRSGEILQLTAVVESRSGDSKVRDLFPGNNAIDFRVAATTRNRKLLIVDGSSRWEVRYLKNLFARDPVWETNWVLFGAGTDTVALERGDTPGTFPDSIETMSQYDAIILGDIDARQFTDLDRGRLLQYVSSGGGLIVIDGRFGLIRPMVRDDLSELMPVRVVDQSQPIPPKHISPTVAGLEQPTLGLIEQSSELQTFWQSLPAPKWGAPVELAEGAESWADLMRVDGSSTPWLATRMYGAGRVFYFSSDQTWRWRYKVADKFHARFWNQLVVAAIEPPYSASDQFVSIGTDKVEYEDGQSVAVRARVKDMRGKPVPDATVDALVLLQEQVVATVPLSVDNPQRGTYAGLVPPLPSGKYSIRIRASGFDESALLASTPIWVTGRNNAEFQRMSLDENSLRQIATAGGGEYVHESDADYMLELLKPLSSGTVIETDTILWQSFGWFWIIIVLLAAEWWLRKRSGLV